MKIQKLLHPAALLLIAALCPPAPAIAQGTAITYQGRLTDNAGPVNGSYDFNFQLFDAASGGASQGSLLAKVGVPVSDGLFTVTLDFGASPFNAGDPRWLEIKVRTNNAGAYGLIAPRLPLTATPYAVTAGNVVSGGLAAGTYSNALTLNNAANVVSGVFTGNGADVTNVNAATLGGLSANQIWKTGGNSNTVAGVNFIGTADNQPLDLKVNNQRGLRLEPTTNTANFIGGHVNNFVAPGVYGATIGGGGTLAYPGGNNLTNAVFANFGTVGGGVGNTAGPPFTGYGDSATVAGGWLNSAFGNNTTIGGGSVNINWSDDSVIGGGSFNSIRTNAYSSTIGGGYQNTIQSLANQSTIGGGYYNTIQTNAYSSTIGGGDYNTIQINATNSTIGGGDQNLIQTDASHSTIGGGYVNGIHTNSLFSTIGGGYRNSIEFNASFSTIGGGANNIAGGQGATVPGGAGNIARGRFSFAAGISANALHDGTFVWSDSSGGGFTSASSNQFLVRATGGAKFVTAGASMTVDGVPVFIGLNAGSLTNLNAAQLSGTVTTSHLPANLVTNGQTGVNLSGTFSGDGSGLTNLTGAVGGGSNSSNAWLLGGNNVNSGQFLGTTNNRALEFVVNGQRALRIEPNATSPNIVGGYSGNVVSNGFVGATIVGGGGSGGENRVGNDYATVLGGGGNIASGFESTAMGAYTTASGYRSTAMGDHTTASGDNSIAMGANTLAGGDFSMTIGYWARATNEGTFVWADHSSGFTFASTADNQFIIRAVGGVGIGTAAPEAPLHVAEGSAGTVAANANAIAVFERSGNAYLSVLTPTNNESGVLFGSPTSSADGGVLFNANVARGLSFRTGGNSTKMVIQADGFVGIGTQAPTERLHVIGNILASGTITGSSDRNVKEHFDPVNPREVLDRVASLPISRWNYKTETAVTHLGPMAQDFYSAFAVGMDDKHISMVDADGVALAAIQGLNQKLDEKDSRIRELEKRLDKLEQLLNRNSNDGHE